MNSSDGVLYEVSVSCDDADAEEHDRQGGVPGAHERAWKALRCLVENRVSPEQCARMSSVVMDDDLDDEARIEDLTGRGYG